MELLFYFDAKSAKYSDNSKQQKFPLLQTQ